MRLSYEEEEGFCDLEPQLVKLDQRGADPPAGDEYDLKEGRWSVMGFREVETGDSEQEEFEGGYGGSWRP